MADRMNRMFAGGGMPGMRGAAPAVDQAVADTSETIHISSLALLKMLKHGRAGVPMEVMGLMLGEFIDDYSISVIDVFAMPQSGTGVSVEAVDPVFQTKMLDMLKQTNRPQMVVGWYHSHPGFGPWLSGVDVSDCRTRASVGDAFVLSLCSSPLASPSALLVLRRSTRSNLSKHSTSVP